MPAGYKLQAGLATACTLLVGAQQAPEGEMEATVKMEPRWTLQFRLPGLAATWNPSMQFMDA